MNTFNQAELQYLGLQYVEHKRSWDDLAAELKMARSSLIKKVKNSIGLEEYAYWQKIRKLGGPFTPHLHLEDELVEEEQQVEPEEKSLVRPITYMAQPALDRQVNLTLYSGDEELRIRTNPEFLPSLLSLAHAGLWDKLVALSSTMGQVTALAPSITYDEVAEKFSLGGIHLDMEYEQLILKTYEQSVEDGNPDTLNGLVNLVHRMNAANKMDSFGQLYEFLKHNDIKIMADGRFIGYKGLETCNDTYVDCHTRTIAQKEGDYIYTQEQYVNNDPNVTCSWGLHIGNWAYVKDFAGYYVAQVVVKPEDVVSVPFDYNGGKLRSKGYSIVKILTGNPKLEDFPEVPVTFEATNNVYVGETR